MLEIRGIDVYYEDLQALYDVSLSIKEQEIVVLIGSNGAGKSTTLKTLAGLLRPTRGTIDFSGLNLAKHPVHKIVELGICMVPEEKQVFGGMAVLENLEMGAFIGRARKVKSHTMEWVYEVFPILKARRNQKAGTLSGGEQKMLLIGRALMSLPKLLMIDELSLGLAPLLVQNFFKIIKELHESTGLTVLLVEQNVRMALELADSAFIIENGHIVAIGKAQDLLNNAQIKDAYFGISLEQRNA
ncbi:ABC transporter ATP-binding protein [Thermodesulfobacteriota bacterium]